MIRKAVAGAAALILGVGGAVAVGAPAQANFAWCPAGKVCLSSDTNGNGTKWSYWTTGMRGGKAFPSSLRYIAESVYNRTDSDITLFDNPRCWKGNIRIGAHVAANLNIYPHGGDLNGWENNPASIESDGTAPSLGIGFCGNGN